ncbi:syrP protein [Dictyobacter sp. S3.2.2.5]|uniref:SyrP protein n=1 Tax=Dictyobacter halimunensis TaxID=3026934 RepID=A0ABQ6FIK0_9CHLR|nr:syrP protein [Dictyobacter sp. S3.2.2.5]
MSTTMGPKASLRKNIQRKREEVDLSAIRLTTESYFSPDSTLPLIIQPAMDGVNLASWASSNLGYIREQLATHGGILFRNFNIDSPAKFEQFARSIGKELFDEYGDLPRENPGSKVYGSTPYPADKSILFHNESSHMHRWPMKIFFHCVKPAEKGGATPIIDCRKIYQQLDPAIIKKMTEKKLLYVRNFVNGLDVSWQQFFQNSNKAAVEAYCRRAGIEYEWKDNDQLSTRQLCNAVARHPHTGEMLFFNQVQLHHISCLDASTRDSMLAMFDEKDLPRNVYYGDGSPIEDSVMDEINALYERLAVRFQWQATDTIMLDNMMVSHSRDPFEGARKIMVAMAEIISQDELLSLQ